MAFGLVCVLRTISSPPWQNATRFVESPIWPGQSLPGSITTIETVVIYTFSFFAPAGEARPPGRQATCPQAQSCFA
jgi:hypothetical protein